MVLEKTGDQAGLYLTGQVAAAYPEVRLWPTHQLVGVAIPRSAGLIRRDATLRILGALHLGVFEQPARNDFFSKLLMGLRGIVESWSIGNRVNRSYD